MSNFIAFLVNFLAYGIVFILIVALIILACFLGVKWTKRDEAKKALEEKKADQSE